MRKPRNGAYTHISCPTADGQNVMVECPYDKQEEVRRFFAENIFSVRTPVSHKANVEHGCFEKYSRYDLVKHDYGASMASYIELLEIKDAPDGRASVVINYHGPNFDSFFCEWENLELAKQAFKNFWGSADSNKENAEKLPGFKRFVPCPLLTPWFYAVGDEELIGDYAMPHRIEDDPVFRLGRPFLVFHKEYNKEETSSVKFCLGARHYAKENSDYYGHKEEKLRTLAVFDDGSTWENGNDQRQPIPLEGEELTWYTEAMNQFQHFLSGDSKEVEIAFADGQKFIGRWGYDKSRMISQAGSFFCKINLKGVSEQKIGWINDFVPSVEHPNIIAWAEYNYGKRGKVMEKMEITKFRPPGTDEIGEKKWSGIYYKK